MYRIRNYLLIGVIALCSTQTIFADVSTTGQEIQFIIGEYSSARNSNLPLILSSVDSGRSWSHITNHPVKETSSVYTNALYTISCAGTVCITGGLLPEEKENYRIKNIPLLISQDAGQSWKYILSPINMPIPSSMYVYDVHCSQSTCIAASSYFGYEEPESPLFLVSHDKGSSWKYYFLGDLEGYEKTLERIKNVSCDGRVCISIVKNKSRKGIPLISFNGGDKWTFISSFVNMPEPEKMDVKVIKCRNNNCIAAANYDSKLLFSVSMDKGKHWRYVRDVKNLPLEMYKSQIKHVSFADDMWVAAGWYDNFSKGYKMLSPFFVISNDQGQSWTYVSPDNIKGLPDKDAFLNSLSCTKDVCVAVGAYKIDDDYTNFDSYYTPILLTSYDKGESWTNVANSIENLPPIKGAEINEVNCTLLGCTAFGHYHRISCGDKHSLCAGVQIILSSRDKGKHWSYVNVPVGRPFAMTTTRI